MADAPLRRIREVSARPGYRILVTWERGPRTIVDLSAIISKGGVFSDLADASNFNAVRIGAGNRIVEWPIPADDEGYPIVEIDADALFHMFEQQRNSQLASNMNSILEGARSIARAAGSRAGT